jgi:hypothetical protein
MSRRCDRRRCCAVGAGTHPAIAGDHNDEPQHERGQQQSVGQDAVPAHGTSDRGEDLASCPEVERAASIGSAYVGSNPRPTRHDEIHKIFETPCCSTKRSACVRMSHVPSHADSLIAYQQLDTKAMDSRPTTSIIGACWVCCSGGVAGPVLIMTQPGPGSDHVRCPPPQDPITRAFAVRTIAWVRCPLDRLPSCSRLRTSSLRRWAAIYRHRWLMPSRPSSIGLRC